MANASIITSTEWIEGASDYGRHLCNPKMQIALCIGAMAYELQAIGGTDYRSDYESLIQVSDVLSKWMNPDQLRAAEVNIRYQTAEDAGATNPATLTDKLENVKKLLEYDEQTLMRAKLYMIGSLGRHESF